MNCVLTAQLGNVKRRRRIREATSFEATCAAIATVMRLAYAEPEGPWAKGRIELRDSSGVLMHEMAAK